MTLGVCQGHSSIASFFLYWQMHCAVILPYQSFLLILYRYFMQFPSKFLQEPSAYFFVVRLLYHLYDVDVPVNKFLQHAGLSYWRYG